MGTISTGAWGVIHLLSDCHSAAGTDQLAHRMQINCVVLFEGIAFAARSEKLMNIDLMNWRAETIHEIDVGNCISGTLTLMDASC